MAWQSEDACMCARVADPTKRRLIIRRFDQMHRKQFERNNGRRHVLVLSPAGTIAGADAASAAALDAAGIGRRCLHCAYRRACRFTAAPRRVVLQRS